MLSCGSCASAGSARQTGCSPTSWAGWSGRRGASPSARRTGTSPGCRRTCGSTSRSRTLGVGSSPVAPTSTRSARPPSPSCAGRSPGPGRRSSGPVCARGSFGEVPEEVATTSAAGRLVQGYPALVDDGDSVSLRVLPTRAEAVAEHRLGVHRLLLLNVTPPWKQVLARLSNAQKLALAHNPHGSVPALFNNCLACAVDAIAAERLPGEVRSAAAFARRSTRCDSSRGPGGAGRRAGRAGPGQGSRGGPASGRDDRADAGWARRRRPGTAARAGAYRVRRGCGVRAAARPGSVPARRAPPARPRPRRPDPGHAGDRRRPAGGGRLREAAGVPAPRSAGVRRRGRHRLDARGAARLAVRRRASAPHTPCR